MLNIGKDVKYDFGKMVARKRKESGWTQLALENEKIISRKGISNIETGKTSCTLDTLCLLVEYFGITPDDLVEVIYEKKVKPCFEVDAKINFGKTIKKLRKQYFYSEKDLAEKTNISVQVIKKIENYGQNVCLDTIVLFAKAFGISLVELFTYFEECCDGENKIR